MVRMNADEIIKKLKSAGSPKDLASMTRFGIKSKNACGVTIPFLRSMAKNVGKNHSLALELWKYGIHEARILAGMIDEPQFVTENQMEEWVKDFDFWGDCDQVCSNLFDKTEFAYKKAEEWSARKEEFVKRAGFVLMACLAVHDKKAEDARFMRFLPIIKRESADERNFVKKAVNWALRQIGKRNMRLNKEAIKLSEEIKNIDSKSSRWIAGDALRELKSESVQKRLKQ